MNGREKIHEAGQECRIWHSGFKGEHFELR